MLEHKLRTTSTRRQIIKVNTSLGWLRSVLSDVFVLSPMWSRMDVIHLGLWRVRYTEKQINACPGQQNKHGQRALADLCDACTFSV